MLEHLVVAADGPLNNVAIEARSEKQLARDVGAALLEALRREGKLDALKEHKVAARLLLLSMCYEYGRVEEVGRDVVTLVIRTPLKQIAPEVGLSSRSAYELARLLEDAQLIDRINGRGSVAHAYCIRAVVPATPRASLASDTAAQQVALSSDESLASASAAQTARAASDQSLASDTNNALKCALAKELARAASDESLASASRKNANVGFSTENPHSSSGADSTVRTGTCTFTSTGGGGAEKEGEGPPADRDGWFLSWLLALKDMKPWTARKLAGNPLITAEVALAARYELEHSSASKKPDFRPAGLIVHILKDPQSRIGNEAWEHAKQNLAADADAVRRRQFIGTRVASIFAEPGASPFKLGPVDGQSIEARATEIQQTLPKPELALLHRQAIDAASDGLERTFMAKADPRLLSQVHALIVRRLRGHPTPANAS